MGKRHGKILSPASLLCPTSYSLIESALRHPSDSRVTEKTQVHHISGMLLWLRAHVNRISIHIILQRIAISKEERMASQNKVDKYFVSLFGCNAKPEHPRLCGPLLLSARPFANYSNSTPKSSPCCRTSYKKCLFSGTTAAILFADSHIMCF